MLGYTPETHRVKATKRVLDRDDAQQAEQHQDQDDQYQDRDYSADISPHALITSLSSVATGPLPGAATIR